MSDYQGRPVCFIDLWLEPSDENDPLLRDSVIVERSAKRQDSVLPDVAGYAAPLSPSLVGPEILSAHASISPKKEKSGTRYRDQLN